MLILLIPRIKVTGNTTGNLIYLIFHLLDGFGNKVTTYSRGNFCPGDSVTACKTDFYTNTIQCDRRTLDEVNAADFFINGYLIRSW